MQYSRSFEEMVSDNRDKMIIDIRDESEFVNGSFPGAVNYPQSEFDDHISEFKKDTPIYLICYSGKRSLEICEELGPQGYEIYSIKGGIYGYYVYHLKQENTDPEALKERCAGIEKSISKKFKKEIWCRFTKALSEYELIKDGDKIAVCISGGKDSMLMAKLFQELERHGKKNFEVVYMVMNPGYNRINYETILNNSKLMDVPITVFDSDIFDVVDEAGGSPCYLCARMRRGYLYSKA